MSEELSSDIYLNYISEINNTKLRKPKHRSFEQNNNILQQIKKEIIPIALTECKLYLEEKDCEYGWSISLVSNDIYNAYATSSQKIVIFTGLMNTSTEDEVAFVLAHEIGHHVFKHIEKKKNGAIVGTILGSLSAILTATPELVNLGASIGSLNQSVKHEIEADYFALRVIKKSSYNVEKSRKTLLKIAKKSTSISSGYLSSHPSGPERLYNYDKITEIE